MNDRNKECNPIGIVIVLIIVIGMILLSLRPAHADVGAQVSGNMGTIVKKTGTPPVGDVYSIPANSVEAVIAARGLLEKLNAIITAQGMMIAELERDLEIAKANHEIDNATHMVELAKTKHECEEACR